MTTLQLVAVVLTLIAALAYPNSRLLRLSSSVGILVQGLTFGPFIRRLTCRAMVR